MTESPYLGRVAARARNKALQRSAAVGVVVGSALFAIGLYMYYLVPHANDRVWRASIEGGLLILGLTLIAPSTLIPLEFVVRKAGHLLFYAILLIFLTVLFLLFLWPVGLLLRRRPRYALTTWHHAPAVVAGGWQDKRTRMTSVRAGATRRPIIVLPLLVVSYFVQERQYIFVPLVLLMLIAGLTLLFLQTSALAPFIYTLF